VANMREVRTIFMAD